MSVVPYVAMAAQHGGIKREPLHNRERILRGGGFILGRKFSGSSRRPRHIGMPAMPLVWATVRVLVYCPLQHWASGRAKWMGELLGNESFMLTYGDGVSNVDVNRVLEFHRGHGRLATVTAVRPPARFGNIRFNGDGIVHFEEKPQIGEGWINGGFFVLGPGVADYIEGDDTIFEGEPLDRLSRDGQLLAYRHEGFWQCMDTLRDVRLLESLWATGQAPWKVWEG